MIAALLRMVTLWLARWGTGARAFWRGGTLPVRQRIYCVNHTSHLDAVLLLAVLPQLARPVAAAEYWSRGRLRRFWARHVFRAVLIERDRERLNPLEPAWKALRGGDSLIYFPEGTRGPGGCLQPLKPGLFYLARAFPHVEIVPVWIDNTHRILPKQSWLPRPAPCSLTFGAPLCWDGAEDTVSFMARVRAGLETARQQALCRPAVASRTVLRWFPVNDA